MKSRPLTKYLSLCFALLFLGALAGCSGSDGEPGAQGPPGPPGTNAESYGTLAGVVKDSYGNLVSGATITFSPAPEGINNKATTDANGAYSISLPIGTYTASTAKTGYTTQTMVAIKAGTATTESEAASVTVLGGKTVTANVYLAPTGPFAVNAGADKTVAISKTATTDTTLAGTISYFDSSLNQAATTVTWTVVEGNATIKSGGNTLTPVVTLAKEVDYKKVLAEGAAAVRYKETGFTNAPSDWRALERWRVVPLTVGATRQPTQGVIKAATLRVTAKNGSVTKTDDVVLSVALPVVPNVGINNVPIGQPVLLQGPTQATYAWTMEVPTGSKAVLNDANTRYPDFIPDVYGTYTIKEGGVTRLTIYAGKYQGMMTAYQSPDVGCGSSGACHTQFNSTARIAGWLSTGHKDVMFAGMREALPGGHYSSTCAACHVTGWNYYTGTGSGGSDSFYEKMNAVTNSAGLKFFDYFTQKGLQGNPNIEYLMAKEFPALYKLAGIQCETCHGPQYSPAHGSYKAADKLSRTARIDYSSNSCGFCHGRPTTHGALQQWARSGHGDYQLAEAEGGSARTSCTGCHSAQGFFLLKDQLADGKGNRTVTIPAGQKAWDASTVEPITCIVCHDPHAEGNLMVSEEVPVRISGNTPWLPAGFMATGVGRGAQCIFCHNSRNGGVTGGTATVHEDGNATFGTLTSYSAPHAASQGDVLMGRNAYFLGASTPGERSKHSYIADTCVECHMKLSKAPSDIGTSTRPDHTFGNTVAEVCGDCHGGYTGEQLMNYFDYRLAELKSEIEKAITRLKGDGVAVTFTSGRIPTVTVNGTTVNLASYIPFNQTLAKLNWNYELMATGAGRGTHNPAFTWRVLDASIAAAKGL